MTGIYRFAATILILAGTVAAAKRIDFRPSEPLVIPLESISSDIEGWKGKPDPPIREDILKELVPTTYISRTYYRGKEDMNLFVAYYANQRAGESMHSPKHCLPGSGWDIVAYGVTDLNVGRQHVRVNRHTIQNGATRMAVLYWYQSKRRIIASEYLAKLYLVKDAISERQTGGAIVRIICKEDPETVKTATAFAEAMVLQVRHSMTGTTAVQNWK